MMPDMPSGPNMETMAMTLKFNGHVSHLLFKAWEINKGTSPNGLFFLCFIMIFLSAWFLNFVHNFNFVFRKNRTINTYEPINGTNP